MLHKQLYVKLTFRFFPLGEESVENKRKKGTFLVRELFPEK